MSAEKWPKKVRVGNVLVKVYRVKHATAASGWAYVVAHSQAGMRKLSKFATPAEALEEAQLKAAQLNAGRVDGASMSREDRDQLDAARKIAGEIPVIAALQEWQAARTLCRGSILPAAEFWAQTQTAKIENLTASEAAKRFLAAKRKAGVDVTAGLERTLPKFLEKFGGQAMSSISTKALQTWLDEMDHPSTRNTHRRRLVTFFKWARKADLLPAAAQTEAEKTDIAREEELEIGIITATDFSRVLHLMAAKHPAYLATAVLAGFCGLRRKELHAQKWADVLLERGHVRVTSAKRNTPAKRLVPLCPAAVEWLMICDRTQERVAPPWGVDMVRKYCREAKPPIPCPENAFRHAYISHRVAQTGDIAETSLAAGNSARMIHAHYRELVSKAEGETWFSIRPSNTTDKLIAFPKS